jgi:hypothetical protein
LLESRDGFIRLLRSRSKPCKLNSAMVSQATVLALLQTCKPVSIGPSSRLFELNSSPEFCGGYFRIPRHRRSLGAGVGPQYRNLSNL